MDPYRTPAPKELVVRVCKYCGKLISEHTHNDWPMSELGCLIARRAAAAARAKSTRSSGPR